MPSKIQAISPTVDRLMRLIEGSQCIRGNEFDVELALREALGNAVVHGNQEDPEKKVHIRCRCRPGKGISIIVTDQGKGFDFGRVLANGITADPAAAHGHGIPLIEAYMDDVHFARGGSEVHMSKHSRSASHLVKAQGTGRDRSSDGKPVGGRKPTISGRSTSHGNVANHDY